VAEDVNALSTPRSGSLARSMSSRTAGASHHQRRLVRGHGSARATHTARAGDSSPGGFAGDLQLSIGGDYASTRPSSSLFAITPSSSSFCPS
jgi:hypothetical protein